ncbi:MAG: ATP-grasp domain-containing protein, partial [Thermoplasmatota archaeon]
LVRLLVLTREPRLYSIRRFQEEARKQGHQVRTLDVLKTQLVLHARNPQLSARGRPVRPGEVDVVLPRIGASVTEAGCAVVNHLEMMGVPVVNNSQSILRARDKLRSFQVLSRCNVDIPKTVVIRNVDDLDEALDLVGGVPCILKLLKGTHGVGVMLADSRGAIESILQTFWSLGQVILLQEFIQESKGRDVRAFVVGDRVVGAMRREAKMGEFRSNIHRGGAGSPIELDAEAQLTVVEAAHAMGLQVAGVDYLESRDGPKILEVNASPGFQGLEQATGANVAGEVIRFAAEYGRRVRA